MSGPAPVRARVAPLRVRPIPVVRHRTNPAAPAPAPPKKTSVWIPLAIGGAVAAAAGVGVYYLIKTYGGGGGGGGCTSDSQCPSGEQCSGGTCISAGVACTNNSECMAGETCQNGYCVEGTGCAGTCTCANGASCQSDCGCLGSQDFSCNQGACYVPVATSLTAQDSSITIPTTANYSYTECYWVFDCTSAGPCNFSYQGGSAATNVRVLDQYGFPMAGVLLSYTINGQASLSETSGTTNSDGYALVPVQMGTVPTSFQNGGNPPYTNCISNLCGGNGQGSQCSEVDGGQVGTITVTVSGTSIQTQIVVAASVDMCCDNTGVDNGCSCT